MPRYGGQLGYNPSMFSDPDILKALARSRQGQANPLAAPTGMNQVAGQQQTPQQRPGHAPVPMLDAAGQQHQFLLQQSQEALQGQQEVEAPRAAPGGFIAALGGPMAAAQIGLAMTQASKDPGYGHTRPTLGDALQAGLGQYTGIKQTREAKEYHAQLAQMADRGEYAGAVSLAIQNQDMESAQFLNGIQEQRRAADRQAEQDKIKTLQPGTAITRLNEDGTTTELARGDELGSYTLSGHTPGGQAIFADRNGNEIVGKVRHMDEYTDARGGAGAPTPKQKSEQEDMRAVAREVRSEVEVIRNYLYRGDSDDPKAPPRIEGMVFREWQTEERQKFEAAAKNLLSMVVKQRSGAQATEAETERLSTFIEPKPGDKADTLRAKVERMEAIADRLEAGASAYDALDAAGYEQEAQDSGNEAVPGINEAEDDDLVNFLNSGGV